MVTTSSIKLKAYAVRKDGISWDLRSIIFLQPHRFHIQQTHFGEDIILFTEDSGATLVKKFD